MITLAPSIAAAFLASLAFVAYLLHHRETRRLRDRAFAIEDRKNVLLEQSQTAEARAAAIRREVLDALETIDSRLRKVEQMVGDDGDEAA